MGDAEAQRLVRDFVHFCVHRAQAVVRRAAGGSWGAGGGHSLCSCRHDGAAVGRTQPAVPGTPLVPQPFFFFFFFCLEDPQDLRTQTHRDVHSNGAPAQPFPLVRPLSTGGSRGSAICCAACAVGRHVNTRDHKRKRRWNNVSSIKICAHAGRARVH